MKKSGILSLGSRKDAYTWEKGCQRLGFDVPLPIRKNEPTLEELKAFFASTPDWIFLGGHFGSLELSNKRDAPTVSVNFSSTKVKLKVGGDEAILEKSKKEFRLHENCKVVLWGGCHVCAYRTTMEILRKLFGPHVLLGFTERTGWKMVDAMLGEGFIKSSDHFFARLEGHADDAVKVRQAWMKTAKAGHGGTSVEVRLRAIDPDGQEWMLQNNRIVKGRKID